MQNELNVLLLYIIDAGKFHSFWGWLQFHIHYVLMGLQYFSLMQVDVGNFLRFKSCILYTELEDPAKPMINVEVVAHVTRPELRSSEVSTRIQIDKNEGTAKGTIF